MIHYEMRDLMAKMTDDERVACASMLLGGRVRRLLWRDAQVNIQVFMLGYEYAVLPDMYEVVVNSSHYYDANLNNTINHAIDMEPQYDTILMDIQEKIRALEFASVFWRTYPIWNNKIW